MSPAAQAHSCSVLLQAVQAMCGGQHGGRPSCPEKHGMRVRPLRTSDSPKGRMTPVCHFDDRRRAVRDTDPRRSDEAEIGLRTTSSSTAGQMFWTLHLSQSSSSNRTHRDGHLGLCSCEHCDCADQA